MYGVLQFCCHACIMWAVVPLDATGMMMLWDSVRTTESYLDWSIVPAWRCSNLMVLISHNLADSHGNPFALPSYYCVVSLIRKFLVAWNTHDLISYLFTWFRCNCEIYGDWLNLIRGASIEHFKFITNRWGVQWEWLGHVQKTNHINDRIRYFDKFLVFQLLRYK
jgi:hypothetical protein